MPEGEREEIRQIFASNGFAGRDLDRVVEVITSDPELWTDTMMSEELGYGSTEPNELRAALATLTAFIVIGFIPLPGSSTTWPSRSRSKTRSGRARC